MAKISFELTEQLADLRAKEIAYKFTVYNHGTVTIKLHSITPRVPEGVDLDETRDRSQGDATAKHGELCADLTEILRDYLFVNNEEFRQQFISFFRTALQDAVKSAFGERSILGVYLNLFSGSLSKQIARAKARSRALTYTIASGADAKAAYNLWFPTDEEKNNPIAKLFNAKIEQLFVAEMSAKNIGLDTAIAVIEPDSYFTRSYTVTYPRRIFDPMKYTFDVDAEYSFEVDPVKTQPKSDGSNTGYQGVEHHVGGASAIALISPLPLVLSLFALGSSIIGAYLNSLISFNKQGELIPGKLTINTLVTAPIIAAPLIAFIFYNVYEYTDIGKKIQVGVGWRGAVLIGAMCGLFEERILKAMSVFIKG